MKKLLIAAGVIALTATTQVFAAETAQGPCPVGPKFECGQKFDCQRKMQKPHFDMQKFEQDLKLTDTQKEQARQIREKEAEAIKPIADKIQEKRKETEAIFNERLTVQERQEKLAPIFKEIKDLKKQIHETKIQYKKEFKSILTAKQVKKLEKLKAERKAQFKKAHKGNMHRRPPMPPEVQCGCGKRPIPPEAQNNCSTGPLTQEFRPVCGKKAFPPAEIEEE